MLLIGASGFCVARGYGLAVKGWDKSTCLYLAPESSQLHSGKDCYLAMANNGFNELHFVNKDTALVLRGQYVSSSEPKTLSCVSPTHRVVRRESKVAAVVVRGVQQHLSVR